MTEAEREELIAKMARYIACASSSEDDPESDWCYENWPAHENQARAALAAAEPVIREQCANDALKRCFFCPADVAAAIREGGKDEN